jgi:hypothetical protein
LPTNSMASLIYSAGRSRWIYWPGNTNSVLANNSVTDGILRDSIARSVIGRSANSTGDPADIQAGANGKVLVQTNSALAFATIELTNNAVHNVNPVGMTNGQVLAWDTPSNIWSNKTIRAHHTFSFWQATSGLNPADATTYYVGANQGIVIGTTYAATAFASPIAGTVTAVTIAVQVGGTLGTTEDVAHYVRVNDATDSAAVNIDYDAAYKTGYSGALSVPVAAGELVALKILTPTWVTNPTTVRLWVTITITEN